jgi:hypothetical protein
VSADVDFLDDALDRLRNGWPFTRDEIKRLDALPAVAAVDLEPFSLGSPDGRLYVKAIHLSVSEVER